MSQTSTPDANVKPEAAEYATKMAACCGPDMAEMKQACPCASAMKGRWKTALAAFSLALLAFLISQVGGVLGMIAFFRTF